MPNTLFVLCAGNDRINTEENPNLSNVNHLENTLIVGALNFEFKKAVYSNYGKSVDVYAPAHFILKKNSKGTLSGGTLTRPENSWHLLINNPDTSLHINFNPKYCLQFKLE